MYGEGSPDNVHIVSSRHTYDSSYQRKQMKKVERGVNEVRVSSEFAIVPKELAMII